MLDGIKTNCSEQSWSRQKLCSGEAVWFLTMSVAQRKTITDPRYTRKQSLIAFIFLWVAMEKIWTLSTWLLKTVNRNKVDRVTLSIKSVPLMPKSVSLWDKVILLCFRLQVLRKLYQVTASQLIIYYKDTHQPLIIVRQWLMSGYFHTAQFFFSQCDKDLLVSWECEQHKSHAMWSFQIIFGTLTVYTLF